MKLVKTVAAAAALIPLIVAGAAQASTLSDVKAKGFIQCGVSQGVPGFSNPDQAGNWTGIDVDVCRAVAAAVFGDANKVKYTPLSAKERFTALQSGEIDILSRNTTWTLVRDTALGLNFAGVNYYDGQGFMVRKDLGVKSAKELAGAAVCVNIGTTTELNMADFFRANNMDYKPVVFEKADEVVAAYDSGRCDVYTTDRSALAAQRLKLKNADAHTGPVRVRGRDRFRLWSRPRSVGGRHRQGARQAAVDLPPGAVDHHLEVADRQARQLRGPAVAEPLDLDETEHVALALG